MYSEDDAPPPGEALVEDEAALDELGNEDGQEQPLRNLPWRFVITRQAYEAWSKLPDKWRCVQGGACFTSFYSLVWWVGTAGPV